MSSPRRPLDSTGRGSGFIRGLSPAAWYRYGLGLTVTGSGVSSWADQSGNARHLLQGTDANRPALQADNSLLLNGTSHYLLASGVVLAQPISFYILFKSVTWTASDCILEFNAATNSHFIQAGTTPNLRLSFGVALNSTALAVDTYGAVCGVINGASSVLQINNTTVTGDSGAETGDIIQLGASGAVTSWSNIQVKELIVYNAAHDTNTRARVIRYLSQVGNLGV